jgi:hypothetical protein
MFLSQPSCKYCQKSSSTDGALLQLLNFRNVKLQNQMSFSFFLFTSTATFLSMQTMERATWRRLQPVGSGEIRPPQVVVLCHALPGPETEDFPRGPANGATIRPGFDCAGVVGTSVWEKWLQAAAKLKPWYDCRKFKRWKMFLRSSSLFRSVRCFKELCFGYSVYLLTLTT